MAVEENGHLLFWNVDVIRSEEALKKRLLRKKSHAGISLNFQFNHTYGTKIGIIRSTVIRGLRLTDSEFWEEKPEKLTQMSLGSGHTEEATYKWKDQGYERKAWEKE
ncbi:unnamed protein product [Protopolystoma xenopodis]|uniref:Helix-turn-helix domain-containing protein n=1 Tax=Protopolystoma xenopodis TaxID=117903 RepID=A0A3S5BF79_9PLAT|nr:unnamed protein product [Protopolystoma xenopodis]